MMRSIFRRAVPAIIVIAILVAGAVWLYYSWTHWDTGAFPFREPKTVWSLDLGGEAWKAQFHPADDETLLLALKGQPFRAIDMETGAVRWKSDRVIEGYAWKFIPLKDRIVVYDSLYESFNALCFDRKTGALQWEKNLARIMGRQHSWLAATDELVAATGGDLKLRVFKIDDGSELWTRQLHDFRVNELLTSNALYCYEINGSKGRLLALDGLSGDPLWEIRLSAKNADVSRLNRNSILVDQYEEPLKAYDAKTGALLWEAANLKSHSFFTLNDGADLYGESIDHTLLSIDPNTGKSRWSVNGEPFIWPQPLPAKHLYGGFFSPVQRDMATGAKKWEANVSDPGGWIMPIIRYIAEEGDEVIFILQDDDNFPHCIYAVDIKTGKPRWAYPFWGMPVSLPGRRMLIRYKTLKMVLLPN